MEGTSVKTIRYLALGDSYTKGESVSQRESFPYLLTDHLNKDSHSEVLETKVIAQTGWTTTSLLASINEQEFTDTYDLVTLLIGVNNQYQGKSIEAYQRDFIQCLQKATELAGGKSNKVVVISIPDYGYTPFGAGNREVISADIDAFNGVNKSIADSIGVSYINITSISRSGFEGLVASDGLHPSGKQYKLWVDAMQVVVKEKVWMK
ncbi:MAG: SGNH/GDSL hydrolase family protein [Bacteroidota bacterium]